MSLGKLVTKKSLFTSVLTGSVHQNRNPHRPDTLSLLFFPARIRPSSDLVFNKYSLLEYRLLFCRFSPKVIMFLYTWDSGAKRHPSINPSIIIPTRVSGLSGFQLQKDFGDELTHISGEVHSYNNKNNNNIQHLQAQCKS